MIERVMELLKERGFELVGDWKHHRGRTVPYLQMWHHQGTGLPLFVELNWSRDGHVLESWEIYLPASQEGSIEATAEALDERLRSLEVIGVT